MDGPSFVVVLSTPDGLRRMLSHASLMRREEAEHEAAVWRRSPSPGFGEWAADVREVR